MRKNIRFLSFFLAIVILISSGNSVFAKKLYYSNVKELRILENGNLLKRIENSAILNKSLYYKVLNSAGLAWGPYKVGNLEFKMTNQHFGRFGKFQNYPVNHVNLIVTKVKNNRQVLNFHIAKYSRNGRNCLYVWDSVSKSTIIDKCFNNWKDAVSAVVSAAKRIVKRVSENGNWIVKAAIWGLIIVALLDLVIPMDPIPVLPFSQPDIEEVRFYYNRG
ncbi:hypothetical protein SAMN02745135_02461 [Caloranaerobacter azorensis DSM 13643]|uniref:Uncharacterized protein n=1 Tax=Caloranaerobacter azorensis DSM 13643 TaxID=1121264 RepID=A0A1M5WG62_9FIRM|nr:hypothetical protein [Caloranaerobacter azorensis]SHH86466.1 hypothetical protein SAMN02745135_02461 [Caloranaerobacter azorensis DSM 13643]